jgi:hypothetical protein
MIPRISLRESLSDPQLLGNVLTGASWSTWRTLLVAAMGESLTEAERFIFKQITGREREPGRMVEEFAGIIGRRGGKTYAIGGLATYIAGLCLHPALVPGERGVLLVIAPDTKQATISLDYIEANFRISPVLRQMVEARTRSTLRLTNHIDVEVRASDFRTLRGSTFVAAICDESAFWLSENSSNPDSEILAAVRPGLATTGGPLFMISSPYARRGELWNTYDKHFGPDGDPMILVAQGSSRTFNPSLPQSVVDRAMERDAASAAAEFGALFRRDIESYVLREAVFSCVARGVLERPPVRNIMYRAFCDPSGGSVDSMSLCVGHYESGRQTVVVDALREAKPPFSPEQVVGGFCALLKTYGLSTVTGDRYAGGWPAEQFLKFGIRYEPAAKSKSELYIDLLPLVNSGRILLLDNARMLDQLCALERRTARSGRDSIDHPPHGHDDLINAVAGIASGFITTPIFDLSLMLDGVDEGGDNGPDGARSSRAWAVAQWMECIARYG